MITLLTDFGYRDPFVGVMKGVIASIAPEVVVVDVTHGIEPQSVRAGGIAWRQAVPYFPAGSVHVAVVDPGVGSDRAIIAAKRHGSLFLAPDNGILGYLVDEDAAGSPFEEAVCVTESRYFRSHVSSTFHGRDIFAPVAAHLALGIELSSLGPPTVPRLEMLPGCKRVPSADGATDDLCGEIIDIDCFGNCLTNVVLEARDDVREIHVAGRIVQGLSTSYADVGVGELLAVVGSSRFLEIAVRNGRADRELAVTVGTGVVVRVATADSVRKNGLSE